MTEQWTLVYEAILSELRLLPLPFPPLLSELNSDNNHGDQGEPIELCHHSITTVSLSPCLWEVTLSCHPLSSPSPFFSHQTNARTLITFDLNFYRYWWPDRSFSGKICTISVPATQEDEVDEDRSLIENLIGEQTHLMINCMCTESITL